jgi:hypothetical protein
MRLSKRIFIVALGGALLSFPPQAATACCGAVAVTKAPTVEQAVKDAGGGIVDAIENLRKQAKTLSDKEVKNMKEIADASEQARITNDGLFQVTKDPCQAASLARTFERMGGNMGGARQPGGGGSQAAARRIVDQNALTGTRSPAQDLKSSLDTHKAEYCSETDAAVLGCKPSGTRDPVDNLSKQDADTSVTALIGVPAYTTERPMGSDYIANVNRMLPTPSFTESQKSAFGSAAGKAYLSLKNAERAALSVGQNSFGQAHDLRRPMQGATLAMLEDLAPEYAAKRPSGLPSVPSTMEFIEGGVNHYFSQNG